MSEDFLRGFQSVIDMVSVDISMIPSQKWINSIEKEIDNLKYSIIDKAVSKNIPTDMLQGFIAENFHAGTFNINAVINDSQSRAIVPDVNTFGSPDILIKNPKFKSPIAASLKYYGSADKTLKALSETPNEKYSKLKLRAKNKGKVYKPLSEFSRERNRNISRRNLNKSIYDGQDKIVPYEQLEKIKSIAGDKKKAAKTNGDYESLKKYKELKNTVKDRISDGKGCESIRLSRKDSQKLAEAAKKGTVDELLNELGVDKLKLISWKHIIPKAMSAGMNAAALPLVLNVAPMIINSLNSLVQNQEVDIETLRNGGIDTVTSTVRSFVEGALTSGIYLCCKKYGEVLKYADESAIGLVVVFIISIIIDSTKLVSGEITKFEFVENVTRTLLLLGFSFAGRVIAEVLFSELPIVAVLLGSMIGSVIGNLIYKCLDRCFIALIVESGCTFFGLVDQNYELPEDVLKQIGIETFEYEKFDFGEFQFDGFKPDTVTFDKIEYEKIGIKILRRGVIEVGKIGYM